jgi:hypothetical protein
MELTDRVGMLQTHNSKGESCGQMVTVRDLDLDVREKLQIFETMKTFISDYIAMTVGNGDHLNWTKNAVAPVLMDGEPKILWKLGDPGGHVPTSEDLADFRKLLHAQAHDPQAAIIVQSEAMQGGVCPWCDYGGIMELTEHETRCALRIMVEWFDKNEPVFPKEAISGQ